MSKLAPEGSVVAFEASRQNFTFLLRNIEENGIRNVSPHHCALWNTEGRLSLTFVNELAGCAFVRNDDVSGSGLEKIRSVVTADWAQTTGRNKRCFCRDDIRTGCGGPRGGSWSEDRTEEGL